MTETPLSTATYETADAPRTALNIETRGILFDNDGVLISSIKSVVRSWQKWAAIHNIPNADTYEVPHGVRARDIIAILRPDMDADEGLRIIEDIEIADTEGLEVLPGVRELLASLPTDRWAIVTSGTRRLVDGRLGAAQLPIPPNLITADMVVHGKPHPEPYMRGAELLGFSNADCIVVEDAPPGVGAGIAAGSRVLAVLGTHSPEELSAATWIIRSLEDLKVTEVEGMLHLHFTPIA
ncbi:HAD-IA family hydrolase [Granulicella sibirica]|uniref:Putative phosphatase YfbT n=1 Tax=Granulicella sibirica TaxID=2479048 RepID=A0A4Q0T3P7_9BACT|nr:HAD-IA family hydrolase [Granulicella sibirica]RXH57532.1 putative phosphatase YfbT [Granulicella sibirica]